MVCAAFDITPPELITAIVTEMGIARPPFKDHLFKLWKAAEGGP
jgi:methylthioribose-1-phosphate isomerase